MLTDPSPWLLVIEGDGSCMTTDTTWTNLGTLIYWMVRLFPVYNKYSSVYTFFLFLTPLSDTLYLWLTLKETDIQCFTIKTKNVSDDFKMEYSYIINVVFIAKTVLNASKSMWNIMLISIELHEEVVTFCMKIWILLVSFAMYNFFDKIQNLIRI
jgi:hypothetical protein